MALDLEDKTSNNNDLTNNSATEYTASFPFAASTEAVQVVGATPSNLTAGDHAANSFTNNFTLATWVRFTTLPTTTISELIWKSSAYTFLFHFSNGLTLDTFPFNRVQVAWSPSTDTWYHIAVTFASNQVKFYVNGSQQGVTQTSANSSTADTANNLTIGAGSGDEGTWQMDDIRLYNTVITDFSDKSQELVGNEPGLAAYYPFETDIATTSSSTSTSTSTSSSTSTSTSTSTSSSTSSSTSTSSTTTSGVPTTSTSTSTSSSTSTSTSTSSTTTGPLMEIPLMRGNIVRDVFGGNLYTRS